MRTRTFWLALGFIFSLWLVGVLILAASEAWEEMHPPTAPHPQATPLANTNVAPINCHQSAPPTTSPWLADAQHAYLDVLTFAWKIEQESGYQPTVTSPAGAEGIAQLMPDTVRGLGIDPWNPEQALEASAKLDAGHLQQFAHEAEALATHYGGNAARYAYGLALAAYNAGPGATTGAWNRAYGAARAGRKVVPGPG